IHKYLCRTTAHISYAEQLSRAMRRDERQAVHILSMKQHFRFNFTFPRSYEVRVLEAAPPVHPVEKLYHFPAELEEGDRSGAYLRVAPKTGPAWAGFFALGFESDQVVSELCSSPDPDSFCTVVGGYAYVVKAANPGQWFRVEQSPV